MRKLLVICAVAGMLLAATSVANAAVSFWMDPADLGNMGVIQDTNGTITSTDPLDPWTYEYAGTTGVDGEEGEYAHGKIQVGYKWYPPGGDGANSYNGQPFPNLSGYDGFRMSFHNLMPDTTVLVNLWMNTGYTDPGFEQVDVYAQNGWVEVPYCTSVILELDFHNAEMWVDDPPYGPWDVYTQNGAIPYLEHVTGIGFSLITQDGPGDFKVAVDTIPEPGTFVVWAMLGIASWFGVRFWRRAR